MLTGKDIHSAFTSHDQHARKWEALPARSMAAYDAVADILNTSHIAPLQGLVKDLVEGLQDCWDNEYSLEALNDLKARATELLKEEH